MYISRRYLNEKWGKLKWDMENFLQINNKDLPDKIDEEVVKSVRYEIKDFCEAILKELNG